MRRMAKGSWALGAPAPFGAIAAAAIQVAFFAVFHGATAATSHVLGKTLTRQRDRQNQRHRRCST